jgi:hypothetical protein
MTDTLRVLWAVRDLRDTRLGPSHKAILFALVSYRTKVTETSAEIRPSILQLASATCLSTKQARRVLYELVALGLVVVHQRRASTPGHTGRHLASDYSLVLPPVGVGTPADGSTSGVDTPARGSTYSHPREHVLPPMGASEDLSQDPSKDQESAREGRTSNLSHAAEKVGGGHARPVSFPRPEAERGTSTSGASPALPSPVVLRDGISAGYFALHRQLLVDAWVAAVRAITKAPHWMMPNYGDRDLERLLANACVGAAKADPYAWIESTLTSYAKARAAKANRGTIVGGFAPKNVIAWLSDAATERSPPKAPYHYTVEELRARDAAHAAKVAAQHRPTPNTGEPETPRVVLPPDPPRIEMTAEQLRERHADQKRRYAAALALDAAAKPRAGNG